MPTRVFIDSALLLFMLLNPFLLSIYLLDLIQELDRKTFRAALLQGAVVSSVIFVLFAYAGDAIFSRVLQVRFASFLIRSEAIRGLRGGSPEHIAGSIALPFMVGPGTVSASVIVGSRLPFGWAALCIVSAMATTTLCVFTLKWLYDSIREQYEGYVQRYIDIVGRISALVIGTIAVEMILNGVELWIEKLAVK